MDFNAVCRQLTRRELFQRTGTGIGAAALGCLLAEDGLSAPPESLQSPFAPRPTHFAPRAKNVIHLHMVGAPSHLDLFEFKPELQRHDGELCPKQFLEGQRFAFLRGHPRLLGTRYKFHKGGESGLQLSELLPELGKLSDDLAVIKTLHTDEFNHGPAQLFLHTGFSQFGRPSMGAWVSYGLGTPNANLPAYVVMITGSVAGAGNSLWGPGFLPSVHQGIEFRSTGDPVLFLSNPQGVDRDARRRILDSIQFLNESQLDVVRDPEIKTRIEQYELAFRMQSSVPDLMDLSDEPQHVLDAYGAKPGQASFANHCLLARRLVERGVRFVQLFDQGWDHHSGVFKSLPNKCKQIDKPMAALIGDLKQRGLLDETLVVWGGEFGRTPMLQGSDAKKGNPGRDHHKDAFCSLLAGGGVRGGTTVGRTDELGYFPVEDSVSIHDFHATLLHLLGIDHKRLTHRFQGREFRLTDIAGEIVRKLLA
ncbi:MAG: DUF1501 domain-containing protein [Pirellulaceae bacterium]|nr:DUF1501 domain-containing protein [Pirellulaceae bacterium]MDP7018786.1 DUF1501 domain-containing protein [Pirellulaceae bacterium]